VSIGFRADFPASACAASRGRDAVRGCAGRVSRL